MPAPEHATTLYLRNVPAGLVRQAKMKAARDGTTLTAVVIDALARAVDPHGGEAASTVDPLHDSRVWYEDQQTRLLQRYANEYVAIVDRTVIDHDADFDALATRVFDRVGVRPVFMPRVVAHREPVRVRSPRRSS